MTEWRALREGMVAQVREHGVGATVTDALLSVPRHLFLPGVATELVYRDDPIVIKRDRHGRPVSSSSQPAIMAIMLDQLGVEPGHRVLEIGTGTGYNAALLAHLVGPRGRVVSVDIDAELAERAREHLAGAGHPEVEVVCGDGAEGFTPGAPYDRVIATVGVWDLFPAWLDQLGPGGRVVAPLDLRGAQCSAALERVGDGHWRSRSVVPCGFMRMRGPFAGPETVLVLDRDTELTISMPEPQEVGDLLAALDGPAAELPTGVRAGHGHLVDGLSLWLALHEPRYCTISEMQPGRLASSPLDTEGFKALVGIVRRDGLCLLDRGPDSGLVARGYGPEREGLARDLAAHVRAWNDAGRPATGGLRVDAYTGTAPRDELILRKRHTTLVLSWRR